MSYTCPLFKSSLGQHPFLGSIHSWAASILGQHPFLGSIHSWAASILGQHPFLGSDGARIMKSAAIRLRGSSALPFLAAVRRNAERVASAASCVLRCTTNRTAKAGSSRPSEARRFTSCGLWSVGRHCR